MKGQKLSIRSIRKILEYRLDKGVSAEKTALALKVSKGSVINLMRRFKSSKLSWPLADSYTDTYLDTILYPKNSHTKIAPSDLPEVKEMPRSKN